MQIHTKYFGEMDINENEIITFPHGIPGFVEEREFVLLPLDKNSPFQVLQSTINIDPAFIVVNPFQFVSEYEFKIDDATLELLDIQSEKDVHVLSIVSLKDPFEESTVNLQAPVIINKSNRSAKQFITNIKGFSTREVIFKKAVTSQVKED